MSAQLPKTTFRLAVALLAVFALVVGLAACGSSSPSAQSLVNDTFSAKQSVESGRVDLSLSAVATGSKSASKSLSLRLSGPFQNAGASRLPRFSLKLDLNLAGHAIQAGATATSSQLFVQLGGTWFAVPQSMFAAIQQGYAQATKNASAGKTSSTFASLGIDPRKWLEKPTKAGTATLAGVKTYHLTAGVDVAAFLRDVSKLSQSSGALGLGSTVPGAGSLSPSTISELGKSIHSAHVDIYTGQSDHLLRRLDLAARVTATPQTQSLLNGLSSADIALSLQLADLNKPQAIAAPANPKPFTQLLPALQQLFGSLPGLGAGSSGSESPGALLKG